MNVMTTTRRLAATGAAAALAAAALVGGTTTAAKAAPVANDYTCSNATFGLGPWAVGLDSDAPGIEGFPVVPAGFDAPAGPAHADQHLHHPRRTPTRRWSARAWRTCPSRTSPARSVTSQSASTG